MTDLTRLPLDELTLDEAARPAAPPIPGATAQHRKKGGQLAAIHRHYVMEMARIAAILARIEAGDAPPEHLKTIVLASRMSDNLRAFGTICGEECKILQFHHDIESHRMFPDIEAAGTGQFREIIAKLRSEHGVVHELLRRLDATADALIATPNEATFAEVADIFRTLETIIRSHFRYEETELAEAIGYYLDGI